MENLENIGFLNILNNKFLRIIIKFLPLISIFISNLLVLLIFSYFFEISLNFWFIFLIGLLLSLIIFKTTYFLYWRTQHTNTQKNLDIKSFKENLLSVFLNSFVIIIKGLFFNVLNDLFIVIIIWVSLFFIFYFFGFVESINNPNSFISLTTIITLLSILSGFFQFYVKNYKEKISMKLEKLIYGYLEQRIKKVSFNDFIKNLDNESKQSIIEIISKKEKVLLSQSGWRTIPYTLFNMPFIISDLSSFENLEYLIEQKLVKSSNLDSKKLNELYKNYFTKKFEEFQNEITKKDLTEIRKLLFSNLSFFDEILVDLETLTLYSFSDYSQKEPEGFKEHYEKFGYDCTFYMLDILLNYKEKEVKYEVSK